MSRASNYSLPCPTLSRLLGSKELQNGEVSIIIEGGESLLVGESRFNGYCDIIKRELPHAKLTLVTNMTMLPDWAIASSKKYFSGAIETTFSFSDKRLSDKEGRYEKFFAKNLKKAIDAGIKCPVNVEINRETFDLGPAAIIELAKKTGAKEWEFDIAVSFDKFRRAPAYIKDHQPDLPMCITHNEFSQYLHDFRFVYKQECKEAGIISSSFYLETIKDAFNTQKESGFITMNPDGVITTNPLFSDLKKTWLGDINEQTLAEILNNPIRQDRIKLERSRVAKCISGCSEYSICRGGPSHVPLFDGSGECSGHRKYIQSIVEDKQCIAS